MNLNNKRQIPSDESARARVLTTLDPKAISTMSRDELLRLQEMLGYGTDWRTWEVPAPWVPASFRSPGARTVRVQDSSPKSDSAWTELLRYALLRSLVSGEKYGIAKPVTVRNELRTAAQLIPNYLSRSANGQWWQRLTHDEMVELKGSRGYTLSKSVSALFRRGYLREQPRQREQDGSKERNRQGEPEPKNQIDDAKQWQPLPDEFTGQCGQRVLWMIKVLGPSLLNLFESAQNAIDSLCSFRNNQIGIKRINAAQVEIVKNWKWKTPDQQEIVSLPFELHIKRRVMHASTARALQRPAYEDFSWPPKTWGEVMQLIALLQTCHLWLLMLASGPRASTVLSYEEDCLEEVPGGHRIKAMLYKSVDQVMGRKRDWPAPSVVVYAVTQQVRLAQQTKRLGQLDSSVSINKHLWVQTHKTHGTAGGVGASMYHINDNLQSLVRRFGLEDLLGDENPSLHSHRFRKTLARIVALTLTNAQMILMDCFGQDDPEMTLRRYILSDRAILADVQRVQRELVVLMARDAILESETLGGPMASHIREAKSRYMRLHRKSELDPKDVYELAESLTMQGKDWVLIMPGVVCTLSVGVTGPCATKQGGRNPGNCQSECQHQLLTAYNKAECDDMVQYILEQLQRAVDEQAELMIELWVGQLQNWLYRWNAVFQKWAQHPLVQAFGETRNSTVVATI